MDEQTWVNSDDPAAMLQWLESSGKLSERKLRLFAVACCRRIWHVLTDERSRRAVEVAERGADGLSEYEALCAAVEDAERAAEDAWGFTIENRICPAWYAAWAAIMANIKDETPSEAFFAECVARDCLRAGGNSESQRQAAILHDLFGNMARPPLSLNPAWFIPHVLALAQRAYDERHMPQGVLDPSLLAALADALQEAECGDRQVLGHLRQQEGVHWRGCWVVDAILGKN